MLTRVRRIAPFVLAGILLVSLVRVIIVGDREDQIMVALLALILALLIWQQRRPEP